MSSLWVFKEYEDGSLSYLGTTDDYHHIGNTEDYSGPVHYVYEIRVYSKWGTVTHYYHEEDAGKFIKKLIKFGTDYEIGKKLKSKIVWYKENKHEESQKIKVSLIE